jgi:hypothetical protein
MARLILAVTILAAGFVAAGARAETPDDQADTRFTFNQMNDGFLRLDRRTGQVSFCTRSTGWTCRLVPDDRAAYEAEITRLQSELDTLKTAQADQRALTPIAPEDIPRPPAPLAEATPPGKGPVLTMPSDADVDRAMAFIEKLWKRLVEMMSNLQRDLQKKT